VRRIAIAVFVVAVAAVGPPLAGAAHAAACPQASPQEKGAAALPRLRYPWRDLGYSVEFQPGRDRYLGMTYPGEHRIEIYVRSCQTVESVTHVVGHEVGHAVDATYNDAGRRQEWERIRGFSGEWFPCDGCSDYRAGAGDFAEVFSYLEAEPAGFRSLAAGPPSPEQAVELERFFHSTPAPEPVPPVPGRGLLNLPRLLPGLSLPGLGPLA
jgi:hypothetical protein